MKKFFFCQLTGLPRTPSKRLETHLSVQLEALRSRISSLERLVLNQANGMPSLTSLASNQSVLAQLNCVAHVEEGQDENHAFEDIFDFNLASTSLNVDESPSHPLQDPDVRHVEASNAPAYDGSHSPIFGANDQYAPSMLENAMPTTADPNDFMGMTSALGFSTVDVSPSIELTDAVNTDVDGANMIHGSSPAIPTVVSLTLQPTISSASMTTSALPPRRLPCTHCGKTFGRIGDLNRHARIHNPNAPRYTCPEPGCKFSGMNGMLRKDRLQAHRATFGH